MATRLNTALSSNAANLTYAVSAASNRRLIVGVAGEGTQTGAHTCDYGGQTGVLIGSEIAGSGTTQQTVSLFAFTDAQIAAASNTTISAGNVPTDYNISARSYQDCEQGTLTNFDTDTSGAATPNPLAACDITTVADDGIICAFSGVGNATTATWGGALTEATDQATASAAGSMGDDEVTTFGTQACECTWANQNRSAIVAVGIEHLSSAGITSVTPSEFDFDNIDVDIVGTNFEASQGIGAVYISDASTLAGSVNEVEIDGAINTWADALINLNFSGLSQTEIDNLHTLGPGARFIIVTNASSDEYSSAITLHRPQAIAMASGNIVPGTTTQRLTGLTGTFAGGRAEETAAQNPSTTNTDVAANGNREDVWSFELLDAARDVTYDFRVLYGGSVAETITQTPQITPQTNPQASGAVAITAITADGAATVRHKASGAVSIPAITASGSATVRKHASGATVVPVISALGAAIRHHVASGAVSTPAITASGSAAVKKHASGAVAVPAITADGNATVQGFVSASGAVVVPAIESSGSASVSKRTSGDIAIPAIQASGAATVTKKASGAVAIPSVTADGAARRLIEASGDVAITPLTADGSATVTAKASGDVTLPAVTANGNAVVRKKASGDVAIPSVAADGTASPQGVNTSNGAVAIPAIEASGVAAVTHKASGAISIPAITADGGASKTAKASGAISIPAIEADGAAVRLQTHTASGAVAIPAITASGTATKFGFQIASGDVVIPAIQAAGSATVTKKASGNVSIPAIEANGAAGKTVSASGAAAIPAIEADGTAEIQPPNLANGDVVIPAITASGVARVRKKTSGAASIPSIIARGFGGTIPRHQASVNNDRVLLIEDEFNRPDGPINPTPGPTFTDTFDRPGPELGSDYENPVGTWPYAFEINNNRIRPDTLGQFAYMFMVDNFPTNIDQFSECKLYGITDAANPEFEFSHSLRADAAHQNQLYFSMYRYSGETITLFVDSQVNGSWSNIVTLDTGLEFTDVPDGTVFRVEAVGTTVRVIIDGRIWIEEEQSDILTPSEIGIYQLYSETVGDCEWDDLTVGEYTPPPDWEELYLSEPGWYRLPNIADGAATLADFNTYWESWELTTTLHRVRLPTDQWAEIEFTPLSDGYTGPGDWYNYLDAWVQLRSTSGFTPGAPEPILPNDPDLGDYSYDSGIYVLASWEPDFPTELYMWMSRWDNFSSYPSIDTWENLSMPDLHGVPLIIGIEAQGDNIVGYYDLQDGNGRQYTLSAIEPKHRYQNQVGFGDESGEWTNLDDPPWTPPIPPSVAHINAFRAGGFGHNTPHVAMKGRAIVRKQTSGAITMPAITSTGITLVGAIPIFETFELTGYVIDDRVSGVHMPECDLIGYVIDRDITGRK